MRDAKMQGERASTYEKPAITRRQQFETYACGAGCIPGASGYRSNKGPSGHCDSGSWCNHDKPRHH
jgi:hypothetical protein